MIDSCTMQFPFDVCEGFSLEQMIHIPKTLDNDVISNIYQAPKNKLPIGIGSIKVDWKNQLIQIDASAKVLLDNYFDGITINTFAQVIETINSTGYVLLDLERCYNQGKFLKIDTTNNIHMGGYDNDLVGNWNSIYPHILNGINNPHFIGKPYYRNDNKGVTIIGDQKVEKNRLIAYCKKVELQTAKNRDFMRSLSSPMLMLNNAKDILRVEGNHTSFKSIKSRMQISDTQIKSVLSQGKNPNVWMLDKITQPDKVNQLNLWLEQYPQSEYSFSELLRYEGIKGLIRKANYCEATIKNIVKSYKCNYSYYWNGDTAKGKSKGGWIGIQKMIAKVRTEDSLKDGIKPMTNEIISYIREQMLKAS
jgi:hypothetical protein